MKLYTEEQVKSMINRARIFDGIVKENFVYILSDVEILSAETPIELPTEEDVIRIATYVRDEQNTFDIGAKWVLQHITSQINK